MLHVLELIFAPDRLRSGANRTEEARVRCRFQRCDFLGHAFTAKTCGAIGEDDRIAGSHDEHTVE